MLDFFFYYYYYYLILNFKVDEIAVDIVVVTFFVLFKGAQIIVFPEYGVYGIGWNRTTIAPYLEYIPDPKHMQWNPCTNPLIHNNTDVQLAISCIART